MKRISSQFKQF